MTVDGGGVNGYLDGIPQFSSVSNVMDINNPANLMNFFLDNIVGPGQGEYSSGDVAQIRLWSGRLAPTELAAIQNQLEDQTQIPEPGSLALFGAGLVGFTLFRRRKAA